MLKAILLSLFFSCFLFQVYSQSASNPLEFSWDSLATLPQQKDGGPNLGLAGAFSGVHNNAMIIAGGANFPDGPNWKGGQKKFYSTVYILEKKETGPFQWANLDSFNLTQPLAYGLSIPTDLGLACIGGMNAISISKQCFILSWDPVNKKIEKINLPDLPIPLANLTGGRFGNTLYIAGSGEQDSSKYFLSLDVGLTSTSWRQLPAWPGSPRTHAAGIVQNNGQSECFYLIKGRYKGTGNVSKHLRDIQVFDFSKNEWSEIIPSEKDTLDRFTCSAMSAIASGSNHILVFGGDNGQLLNKLESMENSALKDSILMHHPGFSQQIYAFHTITKTWAKVGKTPPYFPVTTNAINWESSIIFPSGEISPCVRTPKVLTLNIKPQKKVSILNIIIIISYLLILVIIGILFSGKQHSTKDYFKGGNRIPAWAAGISIFGTTLSAITFMAVPAKTFSTDWLYFFQSMTIVMVGPFVISIFLPFYRRFDLTTAYEYLEWRFNLAVRLLGSLLFIIVQFGRMGIVLLLPSLALSIVTGIDVPTSVIAMGVLSIFYTAMGGIEAVIWTDVVQSILLMGGALVVIILLLMNLDVETTVSMIRTENKMKMLDLSPSFSHATFWVVLIGGFASNLVTYGSDQTVIQRYLTTKDEKSAAQSVKLGVLLSIPSTLIFFTIGTLLFVYYKSYPAFLNPVLDKTDSIFPWFIVNSLPDGVSGLLISAIFAASMSSLDSIINSVATVISMDFINRLSPGATEKRLLTIAKTLTVLIGLIGTFTALFMFWRGMSSLWDQFMAIIGLFAGGLGGIFLLGIFSKRANAGGAILGLLMGAFFQYYIKEFTSIHFLFYAFTGLASAMVFGYFASFLFQKPAVTHLKFTLANLQNKSSDE